MGIEIALNIHMLSGQSSLNAESTLLRHILIVEDERVSRRALATLLTASGYQTAALGSAEDALRAIHEGVHPDIVLVDFDLPGMNGLDLIGRLTQLEPSVIPVLITSANGEHLAWQLHRHGVAYFRKPLDFNRLLLLLREKLPN
jgi:two-component system, NtrC family, response regulator AtoC